MTEQCSEMSEQIRTKVSVSVGRTVNMGNFESVRCDFGLETEIDSKKEDAIKAEFKRIKDLVTEQNNLFTRSLPPAKKKKEKD